MKSINYKREDIIRKVGDKLNLTNDEMKLILETTLDTMAEILTGNHSRIRLELRNFGIFEVKPTKAKPKARNPKTNEIVFVPARRKIHFKPGKIIRQVTKDEIEAIKQNAIRYQDNWKKYLKSVF